MKPLLTTGTFLVSALASAAATDTRPDIILFMVDDMGWQDTSVPFWRDTTAYNRTYHTPNMERLARSGMKFTQAYASAISSPSRCSLMTGANAARHGVTNWTMYRDRSTDVPCDTIEPPQWNVNGIQQVAGIENSYQGLSFVELLRRSGYHTIHCGKAHFGAMDTPGENPVHFGFETNISGHAAGGLATYLSENNYGHRADGTPYADNAVPGLEKYWQTGTFVTEALTREAIKALDKAMIYGQPYYLYMSHYAVHIPIDRDPRYYQKYIDRGLTEKEAAYASLVEGMDKSLGDILDWVETNGRPDNTIIIFMSDNGGYASSSDWRSGPLFTQNAPLNSGKGSLLEGGIREPLIVSWPGVTAPASQCDSMLIIEDFYPTILEMARVEMPDSLPQTVDGLSFVPLLRGEKPDSVSEARELIWNFPNNWGIDGPGINFKCAIRRGDWKLIYDYTNGEKQLFNVTDDIGETRNLADSHPQLTSDLSRRLGFRLREMGAQRPTVKSTGKPCPWPDEVQ